MTCVLHVRMDDGTERELPAGDDDVVLHIAREIIERDNDYEWIQDANDVLLRVEAFNEIWVTRDGKNLDLSQLLGEDVDPFGSS